MLVPISRSGHIILATSRGTADSAIVELVPALSLSDPSWLGKRDEQ